MKKIKLLAVTAAILAAAALTSCSGVRKEKINTANLNLDIGVGFSHFDNESDFPAPSENAALDVYSSKIVITGAYSDEIIETPLIYNNSATAFPRMKLEICGNRMFVIYCPDISLPSLQIASTDDGGENWIQSTLKFSPSGEDTDSSLSVIDEFCASFWSTKNGAVMIFDAASGTTYTYFTEDSGKTFKSADGTPEERNWHDSLYKGGFLSANIGFASYSFYSYPPNEPQVDITLDGGKTWSKMEIKVPASVMTAYSLAGKPYYDGSKIILPIELYDENDAKVDEKQYVSYDFGITWRFYADDGQELNIIRNTEGEKWFEANRPASLASEKYFISDFSLISSFELDSDVRIDAYKFVASYNIEDWSRVRLTGNMYFDENADLYYKEASGFPILLFAYEGDVFDHTYSLMGSVSETAYTEEGEEHLSKRLYEEYTEHRNVKLLYNDAAEAYSWFTGYADSASLQSTGKTMEYSGALYEGVAIGDITSREILKAHLGTLFSEEIVGTLMDKYVGSKGTPLFIDGEDGLYRYGGYAALYGYKDIPVKLTVSDMSASKATLNVSVSTDFYGDLIEFTEKCSLFVDTDGKWKLNSFLLAAERAHEILQGKTTGTENGEVDRTEESINDISDWEELGYSGIGSMLMKQFTEALIEGDTESLSKLTGYSSSDVMAEYAKIKISDYSVSKVYEDGRSRLRLDYTVENAPENPTELSRVGEHSAYIEASKNSVYLTKADTDEKSKEESFLCEYFSSMLRCDLPDISDLRYDESKGLTDFIIKRFKAEKESAASISARAYIIFGAHDFTPSEALLGEHELYYGTDSGSRGLGFEVIGSSVSGDSTFLTLRFYADASGLVSAGERIYELEENGADFKFADTYETKSSPHSIYKIT